MKSILILAGSGTLILANQIYSSTSILDKNDPGSIATTQGSPSTTVKTAPPHLRCENTASDALSDAVPIHDHSSPCPTSPAIHSTRGNIEARDGVHKLPEYWPIMIELNGYEVEIPILRDNATKFCQAVMKNSGTGKETDSSGSIKNSTVVASTTSRESKPSSQSKSSAAEKTQSETDDIPTSTADDENVTTTATKENTAKATTTDAANTTENKTTSKQMKSLETVVPSSEETLEFVTENEATATATAPSTNKKPAKSSAIPTSESNSDANVDDQNEAEATNVDEESAAQLAASKNAKEPLSITSDVPIPFITRPSATSYISLLLPDASSMVRTKNRTSALAWKTGSSQATTAPSMEDSMKAKREEYTSSGSDNVLPWYRAPFVWRRRDVATEDDEEAVNRFTAVTFKPAGSAALETDDKDEENVKVADHEPTKPTFGIHLPPSTSEAKPTSKPSVYQDEDEAKPSTGDIPPASKGSHNSSPSTSKPIKPPASTDEPSDSKPTKQATPSTNDADSDTTSIATPTASGLAGATPADTNDTTTKHAPNVRRFMSWYIFWGVVYICSGFWQIWRTTRADYHIGAVDAWVADYGRNVQADGRTPVRYALGLGKEGVGV